MVVRAYGRLENTAAPKRWVENPIRAVAEEPESRVSRASTGHQDAACRIDDDAVPDVVRAQVGDRPPAGPEGRVERPVRQVPGDDDVRLREVRSTDRDD